MNTYKIQIDGIEYTYIFTGGLIRIISPEGLSFTDEVKIISRIHFESYMNEKPGTLPQGDCMRFCPECADNTLHSQSLYDPDEEDGMLLWTCCHCGESTDIVNEQELKEVAHG